MFHNFFSRLLNLATPISRLESSSNPLRLIRREGSRWLLAGPHDSFPRSNGLYRSTLDRAHWPIALHGTGSLSIPWSSYQLPSPLSGRVTKLDHLQSIRRLWCLADSVLVLWLAVGPVPSSSVVQLTSAVSPVLLGVILLPFCMTPHRREATLSFWHLHVVSSYNESLGSVEKNVWVFPDICSLRMLTSLSFLRTSPLLTITILQS